MINSSIYKRIRPLSMLLIFSMAGSSSIFAQQVQFSAKGPGSVEKGRSFSVTYTVNQNDGKISIPTLPEGIKLVGGPSQSSGSQTTIINGRVESYSYVQYSYSFQADKEGNFQIPPATFILNGKSYTSNAVTISVTPSAVNEKTVYIQVIPNKREAYVGEQVVVTVKLYSQYRIERSMLNPPDYQGFYKQDVELPEQRKIEEVNGTRYMTEIMQRVILFPQKTGRLEITGGTATVSFMSNSNSFWNFGELVSYNVDCKNTYINVKPLPDNAPAGFKGAVGSFSLQATVNSDKLKTNEAFTFKVILKGEGNIKLTPAPQLNLPTDFELYDPKLTENITNSNSGQSGSKTFEYIAIPRYASNFRVSPVSLTYFDPDKKEYKTLKTNEFNLVVEKGDDSLAPAQVIIGSGKDIELIGSDIRYIQSKTRFIKSGESFFGSVIYYLLFPIIILIIILIILLKKQQIKNSNNTWATKNKKANKLAVKRLKTAYHYFKQNKNELFYDELAKALWGYISDKLSIQVSQLSKEKARELLGEHQVDQQLIEALLTIIDDCEFARYAPNSGQQAMQEHYENAMNVIGKIEQVIR